MAQDYYKILGLKKNASTDEIQKAYRKLARQHHPDLNQDDKSAKEKFQKIQQAYDILNDPEKRKMYDRFGPGFENAAGAGPQGQSYQAGPGGFQDIDFSQIFGQGGGGGGGGGFEDFFRQFTGGDPTPGEHSHHRGGRRRPRTRGADLHHTLTIPFKASIAGGEAPLSVRREDGRIESISVKIPAGIENDKKLRVRGQGGVSPNGGPSGDLLVRVQVIKHPFYRRTGQDLEVTVPLTLAEAAAGAKIDVPTPKGDISLTIPAGTSSGKRLRLKGLGVPNPKGQAGDLYAAVQIILPPELDAEDIEILQRIEKRHPLSPRADLKW